MIYINTINTINTGDTAFNIMSIALVFFMIPGLALFYGGLVRKKNILNIMASSFILIGVITLQWILLGYSLSFAPNNIGVIGGFSFAGFSGVGIIPNSDYAATIPHLSFAVYQLMFAIITPAIISGAVAERMRFPVFVLFASLWSLLVYSPLIHWIWGTGGWLKNLGVLDFAGGNVVHVCAGVSALVAAIMLGKRRDFGRTPIVPHNLPFVFIGTAILWFGWMGFNGGSALSANGTAVNAITTTHVSACSAMLSWILVEKLHRGKPSLLGAMTGAVVGLSSITAGAGFVSPLAAILIGALASPVSYMIILRVKSMYIFDDALDVFACHGFGGIWGVLATGLFASKTINESGANGLLYGNPKQFLIQLISVLVTAAFSGALTFAILKTISLFTSLRTNAEDEIEGLDMTQHDEEAYPDADVLSSKVLSSNFTNL